MSARGHDAKTHTPHPRYSESPRAEHSKALRAEGHWTGEQQTLLTVRDFRFVADQPETLGGRDEGPTPMQYLAAAVNSCITVVVDRQASRWGLPITDIQTYSLARQDTRGLAGTADVQPYVYTYRLQIVITTPTRDSHLLTRFAAEAERICPAINLLRDAHTGLEVVWSFTEKASEHAAERLSNAAWGHEAASRPPTPFFTTSDVDILTTEATR